MGRAETQQRGTQAGAGEQCDRNPGGVPKTLERDVELAVAQAALDALSSRSQTGGASLPPRRSGVLAFTGAAGAGKTTLLDEVRRLAAERECRVLSAKGGELEQGVAFHVVRQLFQPLLASYSDSERREVLGDWYAIIGPCIGLCPTGEGVAPDPQGVLDGLDWLVTNVALRRGPLVMIVDDAHWVDLESLTWLTSFARQAEDLPTLIVVAYRPEESTEAAKAFSGMMERNRVRPLALEPLTPAAVSALLRGALGTDVDESFCHEAWQVTGGNPWETVELVARIRERGVDPVRENVRLLRDLAAATTMGGGLVDRLEQLGTSATRLAWAVAILSSEATLDLVASLAALGPANVSQSADLLRAEHILKPGRRLEFTHPLIATAVYRSIPGGTRVAMHGKAARELIDAGLGPAVAARHLLETQPEGDDAVARQLRDAAREYVRLGAPDAARRCLSRALRESPVGELRAAILHELGSPALAHEPATAVNHLRAALDEPDLPPVLRQGIATRLARALAYCDRMTEAMSVLEEEARTTAGARGRLRLLTEHFLQAAFTSEAHDAPALSRRLAQLTERLTGREATERYLFGLRGWDAVVRGESVSTALEYAERAMSDDMSWTDERWGFEIPALVALTFLHCDCPKRAEELFTRGIAEFEREGWRGTPLALGYTFLGYIRFRCGRLTDAEDFVRAGLRLADRVSPDVPVHWYAIGSLIEILLARGQVEAAERMAAENGLGEPFPSAVTFPDAQTVHAELLLARGMAKEAAAELSQVGQRLDAHGMRNPGLCPWLLQLALATAATDVQQGRELAQEALHRAERFGAASALGHALRVMARLSDGPGSIALLHRAVTELERSDASYELACALVELGTALRRGGRASQAAESLYRGVDLAVQCGADALVTQARDELIAAGLGPRRLK
ncbi:AAA family ATPase [Streptomyces cupreus]|uniref:AAA family ATPase n=1 Tax=Streptomyces cupreus TaxID=2759956 RepID=A0A7X1IZJ2_9ACTN|nr:AAA family ATPase [Streptomyces cupreus]